MLLPPKNPAMFQTEERFWEAFLKRVGLWKGQISTHHLRQLCTHDKKENFQSMCDLRATLIAFADDELPATAFFNADGTPLSFRDICEARYWDASEIRQQAQASTSLALRLFFKISALAPLVHLQKYTVGLRRGIRAWRAEGNLWRWQEKLQLGGLWGWQAGGAALVASLFLWMNDMSNGGLRDHLNRVIAKRSKAADAALANGPTFISSSKVHADIRRACHNGSITYVRAMVLAKHPGLHPKYLVHPNGRLFNGQEICIMLGRLGSLPGSPTSSFPQSSPTPTPPPRRRTTSQGRGRRRRTTTRTTRCAAHPATPAPA